MNPAQQDLDTPLARAKEVVGSLTLDEKIQLVNGYLGVPVDPSGSPLVSPEIASVAGQLPPPGALGGDGFVPGIPHAGIPDLQLVGSGLGITNVLRLPDRQATAFPSSVAQTSSWDADVCYALGRALGLEAAAGGFNVMLAGAVNLAVEPRCGRTFEYHGEDPVLAGTMVAAELRGTQSAGVVATIKHYAANFQETGRYVIDSVVAEEDLREGELLAFEIGVTTSDVGAVMTSYNKVNGSFTSESHYLLTEVLKEEWRFDGWVMSDWGATHNTERSALAGLDQDFHLNKYYGEALKQAVEDGRVPQERLDDMAQRIVRTLIRIGAFDSLTSGSRAAIDYDAHAHLSQSIAERGIVLLKNNGLLPLDPAGLRSIAVIGGNADRAVPTGGGAAAVEAIGGDPVSPPRQDDTFRTSVWIPSSPLLALRELAPTVDFHFHDGADPRAAAGVAGECSAAIVFATQLSSEFYDHPTLELPGGQADLIRHVAAVNARTCVVLETSGAVLTNWASEVAAVLEAWYPGQRGGEAIANVIFGEVNPSGRLPLTFPRAIEDLPRPQLDRPPASLDFVRSEDYDAADREEEFRVEYREGSNIGYKWYDSKDRVPAYCFGHGLSYTSFSYSNLEVDASGPEVRVRFTVSNDGPLAGDDIPQVYASTPMPRRRERRRLVSWTRIQLEPGERHTIDLSVDNKYLSRWDTDGGVWVRDSGTYEFSVGASSRDLRLHGGVTLLASL